MKRIFSRLVVVLFVLWLIVDLFFGLSSNAQTPDTSMIKISELSKLKVYYINQTRKTNVPENLRKEYKQKIEKIDLQLNEIFAFKSKVAVAGGSAAVSKFKKDSSEIFSDFEMAKLFTPDQYPNELGSWNVGIQVSYLKPFVFTTPVSFYVDKTISEKLSLGFYFGHLSEIDQYGKGYGDKDKKDWSYSVRSKNYTYSIIMAGIRGAYHFFNIEKPLFNTNPLKWDFYIMGIMGYNLALKPTPFLLNRSFEQLPKKDGFNYGVYLGARYMYDNNLGFNVEVGYGKTGLVNLGVSYKLVKSDVIIEKPKMKENGKKGKSSGKKDSNNGKNNKSSKGKSSSKKKK